MYAFGTFTWEEERREANSFTYQEKLISRAGTESSWVPASLGS